MDLELDELRKEFLVEAQEKAREIATLVKDGGLERDESRQRMLYLAHQLKGAGGSYGYGRISTQAAELEDSIEKAKETDGLPDRVDQLIATIDDRLKDLP